MFRYLSLSVFLFGILFISCEDNNDDNGEDLTQVLYTAQGSFTDSRDDNVYKTVDIDGVVWMAENLRYLPSVFSNEDYDENADGVDIENAVTRSLDRYYVYNHTNRKVDEAKSSNYYIKYGVLYNWRAASQGLIVRNTTPSGVQGICPEGWHLPSDAEWSTLVSKLGESAGIRAKSASFWTNGNGNNTSGLNLLPGGMILPSDYIFDQNSSVDGYNFKISKGQYFGANTHGGWWTATSTEGPGEPQFNASSWSTAYNSDLMINSNIDQATGLAVRCVQD